MDSSRNRMLAGASPDFASQREAVRRLVQLNVKNGVRALDEPNWGAALCFSEALTITPGSVLRSGPGHGRVFDAHTSRS